MKNRHELECACGHVADEHDDHGNCGVRGCPCFAFEAIAEDRTLYGDEKEG